ncbi:MAG TPA: alpha-2-macroglobulin, partial [Archangium sp.]|nr:alpha-2-macroglobulin [Archangium sp.]
MRYSARIAVLAALVCAGVAAAKPLYITVPRAYGSSEPVAVDVAFENKGPVELRVLKPADTDAFIRAQGDVRRAWQVPPTTANPGNALSRGLNAAHSPGSFLLFALNEDFRKSVAPGLPARPPPPPGRPLARVSEGPEKLVGVPAGFSVVRSQWLNLDLGGSEREFSVPGFDTSYYSGGFEERRVTLPPLPVGTYILQ